MAIRVTCQSCGRAFESADSQAGKSGKCPKCGELIQVPGAPQVRMAKPWFVITTTGEEYGPITKSKLDSWVAEGRLTAECHVMQEGETKWRQVSDVYPETSAAEASFVNPADELHINAPSTSQEAARRSRSTSMRRGTIGDIFDVGFHKFITPLIVKIIYVVYLILAGLTLALVCFAVIQSNSAPLEYVAMGTLLCLIIIFFGLLLVRLVLESTMVLFRMEEHLGEIRDHG
jgi:uncharacterized integral membrane protein